MSDTPEVESSSAPTGVATRPVASDDELAAILAAYEALWPADVEIAAPDLSPPWRYAGRPWRKRQRYGGWV